MKAREKLITNKQFFINRGPAGPGLNMELVNGFFFAAFLVTVALPKISKRRDKRTSPSKNRHLRSFMLKYQFTYIEDNSPKINFCTKSLDI